MESFDHSMSFTNRITIFGLPIDNLTLTETVNRVKGFVADKRPHYQVSINVDKIVKLNKDEQLASFIKSGDLINADGMPIVWTSRLFGKPLKERVTGIDLFEALLGLAAGLGWRVYLLGSTDKVLHRLYNVSINRYKNLRICGCQNGYWSENREREVVDEIAACSPDILFVALSSPKKELFIKRWIDRLNTPFVMGVGGSFEVTSGFKRRAPRWLQKLGLEFAFRFFQEPRRMFKRYFIDDFYFFVILMKEIYDYVRRNYK